MNEIRSEILKHLEKNRTAKLILGNLQFYLGQTKFLLQMKSQTWRKKGLSVVTIH